MKTAKGDRDHLQKRVLEARQAAGYSLVEAAKLLGFNNYQTLSAIERGTRNINANELSAMAQLYGRSLDYFFEKDISPDPVPLWRKSPEADEKRVQRQLLSFLENYSNLENLLGLKRRWKDIQKNYEKSDFSLRQSMQTDLILCPAIESLKNSLYSFHSSHSEQYIKPSSLPSESSKQFWQTG